ncbi:MAG: hypothetical protein FD123_3185 [Bacteroidetes bacterium]|nr:MAG: hypothetical protein FD123_3185 [Bacteroidota bacterium]
MNRFLSAGILLFAFSPVLAQSKKEIKSYKIKTMIETVTSSNSGKETSYKAEYRAFDKEGNTTEHTEYNADGSIKRKELNKFNSKGDKVEEIIIDKTGGKLTVAEEDDGKYKHATYKYNNNGDETEDARYDQKGALIKKTVITYNSKNNKTSEITTDATGKTIRKITYAYDSKGLKTEKLVYGPGDQLLKKHKYSYTY